MEIQAYSKAGNGRVKVFFTIDEYQEPSIYVGDSAVVAEQGFQFYVDDYVAEQIDKCELYLEGFTPKLRLKEGETLVIPTEVEQKQKEIEELERRLKELKGEETGEEPEHELN